MDARTVMVQDLGGGNGTFVNGNRIASVQPLKDGDKLMIGTHHFLVSIKEGVSMPAPNHDEFFELAPSSMVTSSQSDNESTQSVNPNMTIEDAQSKQTEPEKEVMFEIRLDGQRVSVTKSRLFDLARKGSVLPDDLVIVAGTKVFADTIQGIVFGDQSSASPSLSAGSSVTARTQSTAQVPAASATSPQSDPFGFYDFGDIANEVNTTANAPIIRVARRESAFSALWKALDISFSRVYTIEGNDLVIHSIKALYYVVVVVCMLGVFWQFFYFCKDCIEQEGNLLEMLAKHSVGLSVVTFGCVMIIVVVRMLLEMLLLAWVESAKQEDREKKDV